MVLWAVDAHCTYQRGISVPSLAGEGFSALIAKASQSITLYSAPALFDAWIAQARDSGMVPGAYHWLTNADGRRQAETYVHRIERHLGAGLILAVDNEDVDNPASIDTLVSFLARVRELVGPRAMLHYSGAWWAKSRIGSYPLGTLGLVPWDSKYVSGSGYASALYVNVPASYWVPGYGGWSRSRMLQFSSHGTAGGITGNVDVNAWDGTIGELQSLAAGTGAPGTGAEGGGPMAGEVADFAASHVESPDGHTSGSQVALSCIWAGVEELRTRPVGAVEPMTDEQYEALVGEMRTAIDRAVKHALGDAGDLLGTLNDEPQG
jgi:hypothetical protein